MYDLHKRRGNLTLLYPQLYLFKLHWSLYVQPGLTVQNCAVYQHCIYVFLVIITVNTICFLKQH